MLALCTEALVLVMVRAKLDSSMLIIMTAYLLSFFFRLPSFAGNGMNLVSGLSMQLIYGILYFFVFEMLRVRNKLESNDLQAHLQANKTLTIKKAIVFSSFLLLYVGISVTYYVVKAYSPEIVSENAGLFDSLWIVRATYKLVVDLYLMNAFYATFKYLVKLKAEQEELTPYNKRVIVGTMVLLFLQLTQTLISVTCQTMYQLSSFQDPETLSILRIFTQPVNMVLNMINLLGLLYLFHHLGMNLRRV